MSSKPSSTVHAQAVRQPWVAGGETDLLIVGRADGQAQALDRDCRDCLLPERRLAKQRVAGTVPGPVRRRPDPG